MATKKKNNKYEKVYSELLEFIINLHEKNKKRIKYGKVFLGLLPIILILVRALTDGDKIVFLIIWIIIMFLTAAYLIGIEYLDDTIKEKLMGITDQEVELDGLHEDPKLKEKMKEFHKNLKSKGGSK